MGEETHTMMTQPEAPRFQYSPLSGIDAIRLLIIEPGQPDSDIQCRLIHTALSECHDDIFKHYTALSYVWGDATQKRTMFVNTLPFEVTSNLFDALHDLRHEEQGLRLWADAICIDQSNLAERSSQVGLMRKIYSLAAFTVIYLGKSNQECDQAMDAVVRTKLDHRLRQIVSTQILARPWFTRVWVYQELVLSRVPVVQCGRSRVRWDDLHGAFFKDDDTKRRGDVGEEGKASIEGDRGEDGQTPRWEREEGSEFPGTRKSKAVPVQSGATEAARVFSNMQAARSQKEGPPTLLSVLSSRRGTGVSDLRDLIYGHLAVVNLPSEMNIPPCPTVDYRRSVIDVFTDAARYIVQTSEAQDSSEVIHELFCQAVAARDFSNGLEELPSWVPNWSLPVSESLSIFPPVRVTWDTGRPFPIPSVPQGFSSYFPEPSVLTNRLLKIGKLGHSNSNMSDPDLSNDSQVQTILNELRGHYRESRSHSTISTSDETIDLPQVFMGRKLATLGDSLSVVPEDAFPGDSIYAFPVVSNYWNCFVLRPLKCEAKRQVQEGGFSICESQGSDNSHFTVVGQALVPLTALDEAVKRADNVISKELGKGWKWVSKDVDWGSILDCVYIH